ncbi:MAG: redoxin domain-containing protein [Gammaproteobacteria bacterium]|nr:redoxin domain-containing protein [Gammaproteobacteria bacterium]
MKGINGFVLSFSIFLAGILFNAHAEELSALPHVGKKAQDSYQFDYAYADFHRAFALAPGGAWSWKSGKETVAQAKKTALEACSSYTQQKCMLYAVDDQLVFDRKAWIKSWGPYKTKAQSKAAETGTLLGQKFYDVRFIDPEGKRKSISDLSGKVTFVHFWGRWCPSCRLEFNTLIDMYRIARDTMGNDVEFVVLQVREPIRVGREWTQKHNLTALPLSDSGVESEDDRELTLKDGVRIKDRKLARVFPASYVLDKNGIVVFSHMGSIKNWTEYIPFFKDVVVRSGK